MKPFFSIIVPCCNVAQYMRESLDSVANQDFSDWECILGVETSKDETLDIAREYEARDARFKVFTSEKSGSCSASRNTGIDMAKGEYVIFLDGDDSITEGSLRRIHDKIMERPGADLYPCAIQVYNDTTGKKEELRDNYPEDCRDELTGSQATLMIYARRRDPCPMLQMTVFRREHLLRHALKCLHGHKRQDSEFSPRALFLAQRVIPLHEPFYLYRMNNYSVSTRAKEPGYYIKDYAGILRSLLAFHAQVSQRASYDKRISRCWARHWLMWPTHHWFAPNVIKHTSREQRLETLRMLFKDGFNDFDLLRAHASKAMRTATFFIKLFVKHPSLAPLVDFFFAKVYFPLAYSKINVKRQGNK